MPPSLPPSAGKAIMRIRNINGPNSELVITPRPNGGVTITQGPVYVLVSADEVEPLMQAMQHLTGYENV
jgi:hypothetical protein